MSTAVVHVGDQHLEDGSLYRSFYAVDGFPEEPWGAEPFDCVLVATDETLAREHASEIVRRVAASRVDWFETTGPGADPVRHALAERVEPGRSPAHVWAEDAGTLEEAAQVAACTLGGQSRVLCWVLGSMKELEEFERLLQIRLHADE